jgi:pentapeptide MXKDX repeat protein
MTTTNLPRPTRIPNAADSLAALAAPRPNFGNSTPWLPRVLAVLFIAAVIAAVLALAACAESGPMASDGAAKGTMSKDTMPKDTMKKPSDSTGGAPAAPASAPK